MVNLPSSAEIEKAILEKSLLEYVCWRFEKRTKKKFIINHHHITLCNALEDVFYGRIKNLLINIAPRYSKTEICVKAFVEWSMAKTKARAKFIHLSYSDSLALDNSSEIRESIKSAWYQEHWQHETKVDKDSKSKWETLEGGGMLATGTMGSVTGYGAGAMEDEEGDEFAGAIIMDDPMKPEEANSDDVRTKINDRLNNTINSRRNNPSKTPMIIIMQRLHENDMSGFVLNGGIGESFHHVCLPAIDEDGNPLWEAKHNLEQLNRIKQANAKVFAGQYMQKPAPAEGNIIKRAGFKTYTVLPRIDRYLISVDCTFKDSKKSDYVVFQAWAKAGAEYYLLDQVRDKMSFTATATAFKAFCAKHPHILRRLIEDKANGTAIIDSLKKVVSGMIPVNPKDSKEARVHAISPLIEAGNVYLPEGKIWVSDFIDECVTFPNATHDDQVDAMSQALIDLSGGAIGNFTEEMLRPTIVNNIAKGQW